MNRVLVVSVGHLKRALIIFGHGPGIYLNTSELCESRFSFWFSFYSLTLYVLCFFKKVRYQEKVAIEFSRFLLIILFIANDWYILP